MTDNNVVIFDTTLRDGEQSPGATLTVVEKVRIAAQLDKLGVDVIEAGFPSSSQGDFEAVLEISERTAIARVCGLSRHNKEDIRTCADALSGARKARIHTFIPTSPLHMKHKLKMDEGQVLASVQEHVAFAAACASEHPDMDVEWSAEDATRSEHGFLLTCMRAAVKAGATVINLPDTCGYAVSNELAQLVRKARKLLVRMGKQDTVSISVHCHNDLGLAVANSLAAIEAGARQVECTINGIGERAGNAALEELAMAMQTRQDCIAVTTNINTRHIMRTSRMVSALTGFVVQPNKAIVGANAFAHEAGIHQDGMLKHRGTYEIMTPESVGVPGSTIVLGKHSGRNAFAKKLVELGFTLSEEDRDGAFARFKLWCDRYKTSRDGVTESELIAIALDQESRTQHFVLTRCTPSLDAQDGERPSQVAVTMRVADASEHTITMTSNKGMVDATFKAIKHMTGIDAILTHYQVSSISEGADAPAYVTLHLKHNDTEVRGEGSDTDTVVASAKAYVSALNKLHTARTTT